MSTRSGSEYYLPGTTWARGIERASPQLGAFLE
jgi:hypothetical protein